MNIIGYKGWGQLIYFKKLKCQCCGDNIIFRFVI